MECNLCNKEPVWEFTNKRKICKNCFVRYFEKKIKTTIRKYNMPMQIINGVSLKIKVLNSILKDLPQRKGKLSSENLDDLSSGILYELMHGNSKNFKKVLPKNQPLYFLSDKEILLYAKIKKIKGKLKEKTGKQKKIEDFIKRIEQKNPDIRHNIINSILRNN